jgi:hypothetical protein
MILIKIVYIFDFANNVEEFFILIKYGVAYFLY